MVIARGLDRFFHCCMTLLHAAPWFPGNGVKDIWEDLVPGARGLCRETQGVEVVGVLAAYCIPRTCGRQPGMFSALLSTPSAGPDSQAARGSASPRPPPNAARTCSHLHSKVNTNQPLKQVKIVNLCK